MSKRKYKCSVIGTNGYLGRHLTYILNERGHKVFGYDKDEDRNINIPKEVDYKRVDITQKSDVQAINFDVDFLFFFAGLTGTKEGFENYEKFIKVNEKGLLNVLNEIRKANKKPQVIFPSSRLVYKGSKFPLKEDAEKEAKTIYAVNKLAGEYMLYTYWNAFNIPFLIFRICVPYGNLFDDNFSYGTIGHFIKKAGNKKNIVLYGDGSLKRTFTHVVSACNQIIDMVTEAKKQNDIFNIAGETYSLKEVAAIIAEKYNVGLEYSAWPEKDLQIESGDTVFNSTKLKKIIPLKDRYAFIDWIHNL